MTTAETLSQLWEELAAPSATAFLRALRARGISAREKDVRELTASQGERQMLAKGVKSSGKVGAFYDNNRWSADVINYTSRPTTREDGTKISHVLFVQDSFSRFCWTAPMVSVSDTTSTFAKILEKSGKRPRMLTCDRGPELRANSFQEVCDRYGIDFELEEPDDANGLARLDNAIAQIKKQRADSKR